MWIYRVSICGKSSFHLNAHAVRHARRELCKISECLMDLVRGSTSGKYLGQIVKFWYRIVCLDVGDPAKQ